MVNIFIIIFTQAKKILMIFMMENLAQFIYVNYYYEVLNLMKITFYLLFR